MKITNKSPLDRVKDANKDFDLCGVGKDNEGNILYALDKEQIDIHNFALAYLEASINDVHSEDEPTSFDMLQEFMEGK